MSRHCLIQLRAAITSCGLPGVASRSGPQPATRTRITAAVEATSSARIQPQPRMSAPVMTAPSEPTVSVARWASLLVRAGATEVLVLDGGAHDVAKALDLELEQGP